MLIELHFQARWIAASAIWGVVLSCWLMFSPQAHGTGICGRTQQVRDTIVSTVGVDDCAAVTADHLKELVTLDLQNQAISTLRLGDFDSLIRLQELKLSDNELSTLPPGLFNPLFSLRSLYLHDNDVASLPADLFDQLYLLDELTLHGKQLTELPEGMFDDLSRFQGVHLDQDVRGIDRLQQFIQSDDIATPEQFIEALPELHKQRFVFVYDSDGLNSEFVSGTHPRVISWGGDARFVFAWTTDPDASDQVRKSIEFLIPSGTEWSAGVIDFSGSAPEIDQPDECQSCHGSLNKPLWGTYDGWIGTETNLRGIDTDINSENMRNLAASTNERVSPLDFSGSDFSLGHHRRFFKPSQELTVYMLAVEEIGMVLGLRHAQVLFQRLKSSEDYDEFAENTVCSNFPIDHAYNSFRPNSDQTIGVMLNKQQPIQSDIGISDAQFPDYQFRAEGGTLGEALVFLIVHDLWDSHAEVRQAYRSISNSDIPVPPNNLFDKQSYLVYPSGTATAEDELIQLYRLHFGHGNRSSLDTIDSVNPTELQFGNFTADLGAGHLSTMLPRVCLALRPDTTPPAVRKIEISSNPGSDRFYIVGDKIQATVTFSETVAVTGMPQLMLELGGSLRTATYQGGTGTADLVFAYEVAEEDSEAAGVGIGANQLGLNGGTIKDAAENDAVLDHQAVAANASHKVDGVNPELAATGGAVVNRTTLTLTYDEALDGGSRPETGDFTVSGGDRARTVTAVRVNGSGVELTLDVGAEHGEAGIQVSYTPGDNLIRDVPGNDAEALSREPVTNETPDTTAPTVSSLAITSNPGADQIYAAGEEIEVTVTFDETVEVEGTPQLRLKVGTRNRTASYDSGTGTAALVFAYEVADGDEDTGGVSIEAGRIALNGGTIEDEADNDADLDHEAVAPQAVHKVDGVRPAFVSAAVEGSSLTLTYGEALDEGSRPAPGDFTVQVDGSGRNVSGVSVSGRVVTLTLNPAVEHGDTGIRVSYTADTNPLRDAVGNDALGLSSQSVTNTTDAPNTAPQITSPSLFDVPENQMLVRRLAARDTDPGDEVTGWDIVGGADQGQFTITSDTGDLSFRTAPDYEAPGDNEYEVRVEVSSGAGARELEAEQMFTLRVTDEREPPGIPEAPTFSGETAESMTVNWSEPDNTGPAISDYDVQYREKDTGRFIDGGHEGPGLSLTLDDLEPGTVYEVQVRATNDEGTSDWSESGEGMTITPLTVQMTPDLPPPVEGAFTLRFSFSETVRGFSSSDIETQQEPACTDSANNPVFCNPSIAALQTTDDRIFTTIVTPRTEQVAHNYTLTISVRAGGVTSVVGNKPNEAAALEVRIAPPGVTVPISSIGLRANSGNGQVTLRWNTPANNGGAAIVRYEYRWGETGGEFGDWMSVAPSARSATVPNLTNGTEYVFVVRPANALGYGSVEMVMATPEEGGVIIFPPPPPPTGNKAPTADAGPDQLGVREGALVMLDGSGSSDPDDDALRYRWNQISGELVVLSSQNVANPTFTAPVGLTADAVLSFRLLVTDPSGRFDSDTVTITVEQGTSPPLTEDRIYYFPHLAVGAGWQTTITYINYSPQEVSCQTEFLSDQGAPLMVSFADRGAVVSRPDTLLPGGSVHQETNVGLSAPLAPGWARATCSGPVKASLLFRLHDSAGMPVAEAGVNAATVPATRFVTFAEQGEGQPGTGVAYANPSDTAAVLTFTARDEAGLTLASVNQDLSAGGHGAENMEGLFDLTSFAGSLEITSTEPIVTLSLNFEAAPVFSSLPPGEVDAAAQGSTTYYFPHLAVGASWQTTVTYINYSPQEVSCQTEFLSDQGSPLMVSFADRGTVVSRPDTLPPGGSVHQETNVELNAPLASGWARATCSGPVKASLLYRQRNSEGLPIGEAGVNAATVAATRFVTFAEQGEGKSGTGVAYANPSDTAALVTFTAKDADGETLASVDETLLPNGHDAQNMMDLFGLSSFTGSLEVASTAPIVSLSLNFEAAPVFSSLPSGEVDAAAQGQLLHDEPQIVEVARQPVHAVHHHHIALARQGRQLKGDGNRHLPTGWKGHP